MCLESVVKFLLYFVNFILLLAGLALFGIGILVRVSVNEILDSAPRALSGIPLAVVFVGIIVILVASFGCYAVYTENRHWLLWEATEINLIILFAVFMLILAAGKSVLAYLSFSQLDDLPQTVTGWLYDAFNNQDRTVFHLFEFKWQCCGATGPDTYTSLGLPLPPTCCPSLGFPLFPIFCPIPEDCICDVADSFNGCSARVGEFFDSVLEALGISLISIIVVEVIVILSAFYLNFTIAGRKQTGRIY